MRWVPEQGELGCSLHCHTSNWPALSRFKVLRHTESSDGGGNAVCEWLVFLPPSRFWGSPAVEARREDGSRFATQENLVSVLNFLARVGGGL